MGAGRNDNHDKSIHPLSTFISGWTPLSSWHLYLCCFDRGIHTVLCVWIKLVTVKDRINKVTAARSQNNSTPGTFQYHTFPCLSTWLWEHSWRRGWLWPQNKQQDSPNANRCGSLDSGGSLLRCWIRVQQDASKIHDSTCAFLSFSMLLSGKMASAPSVFIVLAEGLPDNVQTCPFPALVGSTSSLPSLNSVFQQTLCLALLIYN